MYSILQIKGWIHNINRMATELRSIVVGEEDKEEMINSKERTRKEKVMEMLNVSNLRRQTVYLSRR